VFKKKIFNLTESEIKVLKKDNFIKGQRGQKANGPNGMLGKRKISNSKGTIQNLQSLKHARLWVKGDRVDKVLGGIDRSAIF